MLHALSVRSSRRGLQDYRIRHCHVIIIGMHFLTVLQYLHLKPSKPTGCVFQSSRRRYVDQTRNADSPKEM